VGDYLAGPNHTLPTAGTGRFASGLSTVDFIRRQSVISYEPERLRADLPALRALADAEGLPAHARAGEVRFS
jgi:histidinol dehydrogenase